MSAGCLDIDWRAAGETCESHSQCAGRCVEKVCHGIRAFTCDPDDFAADIPCLRKHADGEVRCDDRARVGRWVCEEGGRTRCEPDRTNGLRDIPNGCNDDNIEGVDDGRYTCEGPLVRGFFEGHADEWTSVFGVDSRVSYHIGPAEQDTLADPCDADPRRTWIAVRANQQTIGAIIADPCHPAPLTADDLHHYGGPWVRWELPALSSPDHFQIQIWLHRPSGSEACVPSPTARPTALHVWHEAPSGRLTPLPTTIHDGDAGNLVIHSDCLVLAAGQNVLHILAAAEGVCSCMTSDCPDVIYIAPSQVWLLQ